MSSLVKFDFTGKKALVTGAAQGTIICILKLVLLSGIGRHIALTLANNGAHVICLDRDEQIDKLKILSNEVKHSFLSSILFEILVEKH